MFKKLFAICLLVEDFEKSLGFYKNSLGLEINSQDGKFADFKLQETSLAIFEKSEAVLMFPKEYMKSGGGCVIAFQVDNLQEFCEKLQERKVKLIEGPKITPWGQKVAYFLDPDQHIWEVSQEA